MAGARVLLIDDDQEILRALTTNLRAHGYDVTTAASGGEALERWAAGRPDIVFLDLGLPDLDGLEVLRRIRSEASTPVIVLSARHQEAEKVAALDGGADDYLTKPFGMDELLARLRVALRRLGGLAGGQSATIQLGSLLVDLDRRQVTRGTEEVHLTPTEYELLKVLLGQRGRVVTRSRLITAVWGAAYVDATHTLHVHMATLRRKLEENPTSPVLLRTEPGVGYRLVAEDTPT
ncbi:MAG TPA: response regulator transcription factor [Chloroflexota bacterium]|jgi:two-component system KDP operon response regulator KdpE